MRVVKIKKGVVWMDNTNLTHLASQLVIAGFADKYINRGVKESIHTYRVGGIILFSSNIGTLEEVLQLPTDLQKEARKAGYDNEISVCDDQENGFVRQLDDRPTAFQ